MVASRVYFRDAVSGDALSGIVFALVAGGVLAYGIVGGLAVSRGSLRLLLAAVGSFAAPVGLALVAPLV